MKTDVKQEVNAPINVMANLPAATEQKPEFKLGLEPEKLVGGLKPAILPNFFSTAVALTVLPNYMALGIGIITLARQGSSWSDYLLLYAVIKAVIDFGSFIYTMANRVEGNKSSLNQAKEISQKLAGLVLNSQDLKDGIAGLVGAIEQRQKSAKEQFNELSKQSGHLQEKLAYTRVAEQYAALAGEIKTATSIADIVDALGMVEVRVMYYREDPVGTMHKSIISDTTKQVMEVTEDLIKKNYDKLLAVADECFAVEKFTKRFENTKVASLRSGLLQDSSKGARVV